MAGSGCDVTPEVKAILRAMARAKFMEGTHDGDKLLDQLHHDISPHSDLTRGEIADIVSGYTKAPKAARNELRDKQLALYREWRDLSKTQDALTKPKDMNAIRAQAKRTRLLNEIDALEHKIAGGITESESRGRYAGPDDAETARLKDELAAKYQEWSNTRPSPPPTGPRESPRDRARQKVLAEQTSDYERRINAGDFSEPPKRQPPQYNKATQAALAARNAAQQAYERRLYQFEQATRSTTAKIADSIVELHRTAILMSPGVIGKLGAAAALRIALKPAESAVAKGLSVIPGLRGIYEKAPSEGGHASWKAEVAALRDTFSADTLRDMKEKLLTGGTELSRAYGGKDDLHEAQYRLSRGIANIHSAMKVPLERNVFARSMAKRMEFESKVASAAGLTDAEVQRHLADPATQMRIAAESWADAEHAKLQGDNAINTTISRWIGMMQNAGEMIPRKNADGTTTMVPNIQRTLGGAAARVTKFALPITKVPTNWMIQKASYAGGAIGGWAQLMSAADKGFSNKLLLRNAIKNLTPAQADSIARNFTRQAVGLPLLAIGAYLYKNFGGMYQQGDSKNKEKPDAESIRFANGTTIDKRYLENPLLAALQIGATAAWVAHKPQGDKLSGAVAAAKGIAADNPFLETPSQWARGFSDMKSFKKFAGQQVASFIPGPFGFAARLTDPAKHRKPEGFTDELKMQIPGLREQVPRAE